MPTPMPAATTAKANASHDPKSNKIAAVASTAKHNTVFSLTEIGIRAYQTPTRNPTVEIAANTMPLCAATGSCNTLGR